MKNPFERILKAEQTVHPGYEPYSKPEGSGLTNSRNGYSKKKIRAASGELEIQVPRDREGSFEPQFIKKH
jgi:transposase-like protein